MNENISVHSQKYYFNVSDNVLFKKDFDNKKTNKLKLESFYEKPMKIVKILSNLRVETKDEIGAQKIVSCYMLKKLN